LLRVNSALFPVDTELEVEALRTALAGDDSEVFVLARPDGSLGGYVEVGSRSYADGCESQPVAYIEAWYVDPDLRRSGFGRALLVAAEDWARSKGFTEIASDALLDNHVSHRAHEGSGYEEVGRVVQYRKRLT
jgi:aminoglycoside 6'-N-acetyltransferase I